MRVMWVDAGGPSLRAQTVGALRLLPAEQSFSSSSVAGWHFWPAGRRNKKPGGEVANPHAGFLEPKRRMHRKAFPPDDPLLAAVCKAEDEIHRCTSRRTI